MSTPAARAGVLLPAGIAAVLLFLLLSIFRAPGVPAAAAILLCAFAVLAAAIPEGALLALGVLLPVVSFAGRFWADVGVIWPGAVMVSYAGGYFARQAFARGAPADPTLRRAVVAMAVLVVASVVVDVAAFEARLGWAAFAAALARILGGDFFIANSTTPGVAAGALLLEGLLMLWVSAALARASEPFRRAMPRAIVLGATLAALANVERLAEVARRSAEPLAAFFRLVGRERVNVYYSDLNAAGSFFVLAVCISIALARRRAGWWVTSGLLALALWMSGSRAALLAGVVAAAVPFLRPALARFRARAWVAAAAIGVAVLLTILAGAWLLPERGNQKSATTAIEVRVELARTAFRMLGTRPVFGIGVGEFYQRSGEFSSARLLALFPVARNENAHNNFLQVLTELGLAGFAAFAWVLGAAAVRAAALLRHDHRERLPLGLVVGLTAFLLTCLGGHPLLIPEVAGVFWLTLGIVAGWGFAVRPPPDRPAARGIPRLVTWTAVVAVLATLPVRARQQIADTDMEHVGIGVSAWKHDDDAGRRYREAGTSCTVFVPGEAGSVTLPLRAARDGDVLEVELRMDRRVANVVRVGSESWTDLLVVLPRHSDARYLPVELRVAAGAAPGEGAILLVGKVVPH